MTQQLSRRQLLRFAGSSVLVGSAAAVSPIPISSQSQAVARAAAPKAMQLASASLSDDPALHLLRRLTFGITPELVARVQAIGIDAFIEEQLSPESLDDSELDAHLAQLTTLSMSNAEIITRHRAMRAARIARRNAQVAGASTAENQLAHDADMTVETMIAQEAAGQELMSQTMAGQEMAGQELMVQGQGMVVDGIELNEDEVADVLVDDELMTLFMADLPDLDALDLEELDLDELDLDELDLDGEASDASNPMAMAASVSGTATKSQSAAVELIVATILRAIYSKRQLHELMVDFWNNHFNMHLATSRVAYYKTSDDRDVIRPHALGRFADMLKASAQSPAMLVYLDNARSKRQSPNENYARELMELHTLGADGGYTEEDVRSAAYLLTGWSVGKDHEFAFRNGRHYRDALQIMDWSTAGSRGQAAIDDGLSFLDYLAHHPSTANYLAHKLCVRFVGDAPSPELVEQVAAAYLENDTEIKPMLRTIFAHSSFWESATVGAKFRRPLEQICAMLRAVDATIAPGSEIKAGKFLHNSLRTLGQPLFGWPTPDGFPDQQADWLSEAAMLGRWNFAQRFVFGKWKLATRSKRGITVDFLGILGEETPQTAGEFVDRMTQRILHQSVDAADRETLLAYLGLGENDPIPAKTLAYKAPQLAALVVNSPYFQYR